MARCRSCGAEIVWATWPSGSRAPFDALPVVGGNVIIYPGYHGAAHRVPARGRPSLPLPPRNLPQEDVAQRVTQAMMFEAVCAIFDWDTTRMTASTRSRVGKVARELREAGGTPDMVAFAPSVLNQLWRSETNWGPEAVALWWSEVDRRWRLRERNLQRRASRSTEVQAEESDPASREENVRRARELLEQLTKDVEQG